MGIPYSKEINAAFDQVQPLVAAGFEVLQTIKNIAILLAAIQVLTIVLLSSILAALVGLLITMNPDMDEERQAIVTPALKWFASWVMSTSTLGRVLGISCFFATPLLALWAVWWYLTTATNVKASEDVDVENDEPGESKGEREDKDDSASEGDKSKKDTDEKD